MERMMCMAIKCEGNDIRKAEGIKHLIEQKFGDRVMRLKADSFGPYSTQVVLRCDAKTRTEIAEYLDLKKPRCNRRYWDF